MGKADLICTGHKVRLREIDPGDTNGKTQEEVRQSMVKDLEELDRLQELLYVSGANSVLVVLQGMDTSGKDGIIRHVFGGISPLGCRVASFKVPTEIESAHDYLWRVHAQCPGKGELTIFNRSHYECVLVEPIHNIISKERSRERYEEIRRFEEILIREGTIIVKFLLHISKKEQKERLLERIAKPQKQWKVSPGDWKERERWDEYQSAFEDMLEHTSTKDAPWIVVPADRKWYRNHVVVKHLLKALEPYVDDWKKALIERGEQQMKALREEFGPSGPDGA